MSSVSWQTIPNDFVVLSKSKDSTWETNSITVNIEGREYNTKGEVLGWQVTAVMDNFLTVSRQSFATYEEAVEYALQTYPGAHFRIEGLG